MRQLRKLTHTFRTILIHKADARRSKQNRTLSRGRLALAALVVLGALAGSAVLVTSRTSAQVGIAQIAKIAKIGGWSNHVTTLTSRAARTVANWFGFAMSGTITGTVFQDYNGNGTFDTAVSATAAKDVHVAGVTVTAYDAAGASQGSTMTVRCTASGVPASFCTGANTGPNFSLSATGTGPYRLEFTTLPAGFEPSARSTDSVNGGSANNTGTTVQFTADGNTSNVNLAINLPDDYSQNNPTLVTNCYVLGQFNGGNSTSDVIVSFPYSNSGTTTPNHNAMMSEVGTTWGLAYERTTRNLFAASFMKRHTGFGPGGPGQIYKISPGANGVIGGNDDVVGNLIVIPNTGTDPHPTTQTEVANQCQSAAGPAYNPAGTTDCWFHDPYSYDKVGKISLGDIDIVEDLSNPANNVLFVVNLNDRQLYKVTNLGGAPSATAFGMPLALPNTGAGALPAGSAAGQHQGCALDDVRPFALGMYEGVGYAGFTCSAESTNLAANLRAYIYTFDPATVTFSSAPVLEFPLNYSKGTNVDNVDESWQPWRSTFGDQILLFPDFVTAPQPMLTDIVFDRGNMVLGIRDRFSDQSGAESGGLSPNDTALYSGIGYGDLLRACGSPGTGWILENNGSCGGVTTGGANQATPQGPGGGEYYFQDQSSDSGAPNDSSASHLNISNGGLVQIPGFRDVVSSVTDPINLFSGGIQWFNNNTGTDSKGYQLFEGGGGVVFSKAGGIGDVERVSNLPPIEIGNRVWNDTIANGVQDPGEAPISGVTVHLYKGATLVGTAVTDANGEYYFVSTPGTNDPNAANNIGEVNDSGNGILPLTAYTIILDNAANYTGAGPLTGFSLTTANVTSNSQDQRDSDASLPTPGNPIGAGNFPTIAITTGESGANNHTYDIGFASAATADLGITKSVSPSTYTLGSTTNVTYTVVITNYGPSVVTGADFTDNAPANVTFNSWTCTASAGSSCGAASGGAGNISTTANLAVNGTATYTINATVGAGATGTVTNTASEALPVGVTQDPTINRPDSASADVTPALLPPIAIGNQIFYDTNNNGLKDAGEAGINGVTVELYADADMNGTPDTANPLARVTTATGGTGSATGVQGMYLFTQQTLDTATGNPLGVPVNLAAGKYVVCLPASNFTGAGALVGLFSSSTTAGLTGATTETAAPDPNAGGAAANPGIDNDDNGARVASGAFTGHVCSGTIDVSGNEPLLENPDNDPATADSFENLTVDFGFYSLSLGNLVFLDLANDGVFNGGDAGIPNVTVKLIAENGTTVLMTKQTDTAGKYLFPGLAAGKYFVEVDRTSAALAGTTSSKDPANAGTPNAADNDDNGPLANVTATAVRSVQIMLTPADATATGESDQAFSITPGFGNPVMTDNAATPDANSVLKVDFGFTRIYSLGNRVWKDLNNSGTIDAADGAAPGINGVTVRLLDAGTLAQAVDVNGVTVADATTASGGYYRFDNLAAGDYVVEVRASNFTGAGALVGCVSGANDAGDPDTVQTDSDDNGVGVAPDATNGIRSLAVTLGETPGTVEPTTDNDPSTNPETGEAADNQSNRTVDFGFVFSVSIGNQVWNDFNNDGLRNGAEPGINGVTVELYFDADMNGAPDSNFPIARATTANGTTGTSSGVAGMYLFTQQTLDPATGNALGAPVALGPGKYVVCIPATMFAAGQPLEGYFSSQTSKDAAGTTFTETTAPDPNTGGAAANPGVDNDDNGTRATSGAFTGHVCSRTIDVTGNEPLAENPDNDPATMDAGENLTVDFGFYTMSAGNRVFNDLANDGLLNGADTGIPGVTVNLYAADMTTLLASTVTDANGRYIFKGLAEGNYQIEVVTPAGFVSSADIASSADPNNQADSDDNGVVIAASSVRTSNAIKIALDAGNEATLEPDNATAINGVVDATENTDSDKTIDFGFIRTYSLGNRVWRELDNNGALDAGELGVDGVKVVLLTSAGAPATDANGQPVLNQLTQNGGYYRFDSLAAGDYIVEIADENFLAGKPLFNHMSSTGSGNALTPAPYEPAPDADANATDSDDNGAMSGSAVRSLPITLGEAPGNAEPAGESDIQSPNPAGGAPDNQSNLTVDFGFIQKLTIGNLVWKDANNDGLRQALEPGVAGVTVELYRETNGTPGFQPAGDTFIASTLTSNPAGEYFFAGLYQGDYYVRIAPSNFGAGNPLSNCLSSSVTAADPNAGGNPANPGVDNDDNGVDNPAPATGGIVSNVVNLRPESEPNTADDGDGPNSNLTIDFGFYRPLNLGNLVWKDQDGDGLKDANEPGIAGVLLELWRDDGDNTFNPASDLHMTLATPAIPDQTTGPTGIYSFTEIPAGRYFVRLAPSNFTGGGNLVGCISSTGQDTGELLDNNDNGSDAGAPATDGIVSGIVDLMAGQEPDTAVDGDPTSGNQTFDFGLTAKLNLGNLVWKDQNNNGLYEPGAGELGIDGARVELWRETNATPGLQPADTFVTFQTTAGGGLYNFTNLDPGDYHVLIPATQFNGGALANCYSSTPTAADPNLPAADGGVDSDDNGVVQGGAETTGGVASGLVVLRATQEPVTAVDGDGPNGNLTIDFGFYSKLSLGNLVFKDNNNNGLYELGLGEFGVDGVAVELFRDNGNGAFDLAGDTLAGTATTAGGGLYGFTNLDPGVYFVRVAGSNFGAGGALAGCTSSVPTAANPNNDADNDDNGVNDQNPFVNGIVSGAIGLQAGSEPTNDGDGANSNQTIDFGFYPPLSLGNRVWKDLNNDGLDNNAEPGVDGVQVMLYRDNGNSAFDPNTDALITQTLTSGGGFYQFTGLLPGRYFVWIAPVNFSQTGGQNGALFGCNSSTPTVADPNLPANVGGVDNDDNGIDSANPAVSGIASGIVDLNGASEPTTDGDGPNGNQTIDFGFYAPLTLGNLVWKDVNNDGLVNNGEAGVNGVLVELIRDANANNLPDDAVVASQTTASGGLYNFSGLTPGVYFVRVAQSNFTGAGALAGCLSSTVDDANADNNEDNDDNGVDSANGPVSGPVSLSGGTEPTNDGDGNNGNQTVDFGFYAPVSLGNQVWKDYNNNGQFDPATEVGVNGVLVELYRETNATAGLQVPGDSFVTSTTTAGGGLYSFANLLPGDYYVRVAPLNFQAGGALLACASSTPSDPTPNNNEDNDDNGVDNPDPATNGIPSGLVTLIGGTEPPLAIDGNDANGNATVDFGFYAPLNLGNVVWKDLDNSGTINAADGAAPGVNNVTVELYRDNGNGVFGPEDGAAIATTVTATVSGVPGVYNFANLAPGNYLVRIPAAEFQAGGDLFGCLSSTPTDATPNNNDDGDDNGVDNSAPQTSGIATNAITLVGNDEPDTPADGDGRNGNLTLDLGFIPQLNLGNLVWKDLNNDGLFNNGEQGVNGVTVELFRDNGDSTFNAATDTKVGETVTAGDGLYSFTSLIPATYFVRLAPQNFAQNAVLAGCLSSTGADSGDAVDNNDNGVDGGAPPADGVVSAPTTLTGGAEPPANVDGDGVNGNQTIDFGLYAPVNLGNRVWKDNNNDGLLNNGEQGVDGVTVELFRDNGDNTANPATDTLVTSQVTSGGGYYNFPNLQPGQYFVRIPAAEFQAGGDLANCASSEPTGNDPNQAAGGTDNDDNGLNDPNAAANGIRTNLIDLQGASEPTTDGDGANGNLTLDLGFYPPMSLGNLIWKDLNNDGQFQSGEPGIGNVTLNLYRETNGTPGLQIGSDTLAGTTTSAASGVIGQYQFTGLAPAVYYVAIPPVEFAAGGDLANCFSSEPTDATPDNNEDGDDNGVDNPAPQTNGIQTSAITLVGNSEPANDGNDANGNNTLDLGFYPPMNLGNLVWKDTNDDGLFNNGEQGVNDVTVELIRDVNANGLPDDAVYQTTTTASGGIYNFTNLPPANYFVRVPAAEFIAGGDLAGCLSSTDTVADPNQANGGTDNDDNGLNNASPQTNGILTGLINLVGGSEPTSDGDGNNGNLTIDLGFYPPMTLGNQVWKDLNNDGLLNNAEPGVANVTVELWRETNGNTTLDVAGTSPDTLVTSQPTDPNGLYNFTGLRPGTYYARIAPAEFQSGGDLAGCVSSTTTVADPNAPSNLGGVDNDDNGVDAPAPQTTGIASNAIVLVGGTEPATDGDGPNGNLTVDFGFYAPLSLGNLVWKDADNDGIRDTSPLEPGVANVTVELWRDVNPNDGAFNPAVDQQLMTAQTNGAGEYQFNNLQPGNYFVRISANEFQAGGDLAGCLSSTVTVADPNLPANVGGVDNDDNGIDSATPQTAGIVSGSIALAGGAEPTTDGDGPNGNQTIDFGFYTPLSLGNLVWKDTNNNGLKDGTEQGVANVTVELWRDNGNGTFDPNTDSQVTPNQTTNGSGLYSFTGLLPGGYFVRLAASNFTGAGPLVGCAPSSTTNPNPNDDKDNDNNATSTANGIVTGLVTLSGAGEPPSNVDGDGPNANQTVDFGLTTGSMSLGNLVFKDLNANGIKDGADTVVANVKVELFTDTNNNQQFDDGVDGMAGMTTTNAQGVYSFTSLVPGNYFVRIAASNFASGAALAGCISSAGVQAANNDADNDDNGSDSVNPAANPPVSTIISLVQNAEPDNDGDGKNGNQTIDFGFVALLDLGIVAPPGCTGPGEVLSVSLKLNHFNATAQANNAGHEFAVNLPVGLFAVTGSAAVSGPGVTGSAAIAGSQVTFNGTIPAGVMATLTFKAQVGDQVAPGTQLCVTATAGLDADNNGSNETSKSAQSCLTTNCDPLGPGAPNPGCSVLIYPIYTSSATSPNASNTRINLTNTSPSDGVNVHLFFVDGSTCAISDSYLCLTANQTSSFVASDVDPGVTGYVMAVAVDNTGCPINFNYLLGDEYVKFDSGHAGSLTAECVRAIPGGIPACTAGSSTAALNFDGVSYSRLPRVAAVDSIADRASGNDTLLIVDRISGNLATGADKLGAIFGLLYDDVETPYSFQFTPSSCQFRASLSNNFPRTTPRYEQVIPAGRTGWLKLWSQSEAAIVGASINRNPNSASSSGAFNGAHGLHTLTTTSAASVTIPVFPPSC